MTRQKSGRFVLLLLMAALLLSACIPNSGETDTPTTPETEVTAAPTGTETFPGMNLEILEFHQPEPENVLPTAPEDPDLDFPVPYDPEREIYFTCENWDIDIYLESTGVRGISFYIISEDDVPVEDIQVTIPVKTGYSRIIAEQYDTQEIIYTSGNMGLPYFLYQIYQGTDWKTLGKMAWQAIQAQEYYNLFMEENDWRNASAQKIQELENSPEIQHLNRVQQAAQDAENALRPYFESLNPEDLPQFYCYSLAYVFDGEEQFEESFQTIDIDFGGTRYTQDIGEVRLHPGSHPAYSPGPTGISKQMLGASYRAGPWTDGLEGVQAFGFVADVDLVLTGAYIYEEEIETIGGRVVINSFAENSMDFYWDLRTPVPVAAGDEVEITIYFRDERMKAMHYGNYFCPCLNYEIDGTTYLHSTDIDNVSKQIPWLIYAVAFHGLDCESYFRDYYYPVLEPWREELPWQVAP